MIWIENVLFYPNKEKLFLFLATLNRSSLAMLARNLANDIHLDITTSTVFVLTLKFGKLPRLFNHFSQQKATKLTK